MIEKYVASLLHQGFVLWSRDGRLGYQAPTDIVDPVIEIELNRQADTIVKYLGEGRKCAYAPSAQRRILFEEQMAPGAGLYNMLEGNFRVVGKLDVTLLIQCFEQLFHRHESLRTVFAQWDGHFVQIVQDDAIFDAEMLELGPCIESEQESRAQEMVARELKRPFDLQKGPLFRVRIIRVHDELHWMVIAVHHAVFDGWSFAVFMRELNELYKAARHGETIELPPLASQYTDYAQNERITFTEETIQRKLGYWLKQLDGELPALELPVDRTPSLTALGSTGFPGECFFTALSPEQTQALHAFADSQKVTVFVVMLAAFEALLYRYTQQEDFVVGTVAAGRTKGVYRNLTGMFVNTLALRAQVSGERSFEELLQEVSKTAIGAVYHQNMPFDLVVDALKHVRDGGQRPLVQAMFVMQNLAYPDQRLDDCPYKKCYIASAYAKLDLTLVALELEGVLNIHVEYRTDLFSRERIQKMLEHYLRILSAVCHHPEQPLYALPLFDEQEQSFLLNALNDTAQDHPTSPLVPEKIATWVETQPDAIAVQHGTKRLTYAELDARANRVAARLRAMGVGAESIVAVCLERSPDLVAVLLGVWKAGGAYLPIDPDYPQSRIQLLLNDSAARVVITRSSTELPQVSEGCSIVCLDDSWNAFPETPEAFSASGIKPNDLAYVIYTSGSTGTPKGVAVEHATLLNCMYWSGQAFGFAPGERGAQMASPSFDASVFEIWSPLTFGGTLCVVDDEVRTSPEGLRDWLLASQVNVAVASTVMAEALLDLEWPQECALRILMTAGEALHKYPRPGLPFRLSNNYGPTENSVATTMGFVPVSDGNIQRPPTLGRPIPNVQVYILDKYLKPVPLGARGEIYIGGKSVARGYLTRPELTAERFLPNPFGPGRIYKSGDLGRYLPDGEIEFLGRVDDQVKLRGYRIELGEIENVLMRHPSVREAAVIVREIRSGDKQLVAYAALREPDAITSAALREYLRAELPSYMAPSLVMLLDALPVTPNGKVDRRALPAPDRDALSDAYVAPRTETEIALAAIWSEVMGIERIGLHDNFFDLGGHSLLATQVLSRVRDVFGVEIPLRDFFTSPQLKPMALHIESGKRLQAPPMLPVPRDQILPLSFPQQRLWVIAELTPGSSGYNVPGTVHLQGVLQLSALESAFAEIVRRHEILRTTFRSINGVPSQVIAPAPDAWPIKVTDLRGLPDADREEAIRAHIHEETYRTFDLIAGPLFRTDLVRVADDEYFLSVTTHHIVSDGWSIGILFHELAVLYDAFVDSQASPLSPLSIQYADFAAWQRTWLQGDVIDRYFAYWQERLADLPTLELPTDYARPVQQTFNGAARAITCSAELSQGLHALSKRAGATLFMTLLAAFKVLLHRYTGQDDLVVGSPIANRNRAETEPLIGFFVNSLVLRSDLSGNPTFLEVIDRVRETALGAYDNQDLPFEMLVEHLNPVRDRSRNPLFQVIFALLNTPMNEQPLSGLKMQARDAGVVTARMDLEVFFQEKENCLSGGLIYNTDLFKVETIEHFHRHLLRVFEAVVSNPHQRISEIVLLDSEEQSFLLNALNDTAQDSPTSPLVPEKITTWVETQPDAIAVQHGTKRLTYAELDARANRVAARLHAMGVGAESIVAVCLERSPDLVAVLLGVWKAGGAYLPIDPDYPQSRIQLLLNDSAARVVITRSSTELPQVSEGCSIVCLDDSWNAFPETPELFSASGIKPNDLAYVIYTSGSTGTPKGVAVEHATLLNCMYWSGQAFGFAPGERGAQMASPSFDASVFEIWSPLTFGGTLCVVDDEVRTSPEGLRDWLLATQVNVAVASTVMAEALLDLQWPQECALRILMTAGEALHKYPRPGLPFRLSNNYGPTENSVATTMGFVPVSDGNIQRPPTLGRPIPNVQVYILDKYLKPVPLGARGEIYIGGKSVARGYLTRPELTAERFLPNPFGPGRIYKSGDLGRYLPDGEIEFLGRVDDQVKLRGYRIELGEIENVLMRHPSVREAAVIVREIRSGDKQLVAYAALREPDAITSAALREYLRAELPSYMAPSLVMLLDALPVTPNGKVDRRALPAPDRDALSDAYVAPRTETEIALAVIWSEVMGIERIGLHDNFFDLGGHSILAMRLVYEIEKAFTVRIPLASLFETPTISQLAQVLDRVQPGEQRRVTATCIARRGTREPFFCIPGIRGEEMLLSNLAAQLNEVDRPFYVIAFDELSGSIESLETLAGEFIEEIQRVQPRGPYYLAGLCFGGVLAYEIAQQLTAHGEQVAFVALLEAYAPPGSQSLFGKLRTVLDGLSVMRWWEVIGYMKKRLRERKQSIVEGTYLALLPKRFRGARYLKYRQRLDRRIRGHALMQYVAKPYAGKVCVFRATGENESLHRLFVDNLNGWRPLCADIESHTFACGHADLMLPSHVGGVAVELRRYLTES